MSDSHIAEKEVFFAMKKLYTQLYNGEEEFRKACSKDREVELVLKDEENTIYSIKSSGVDLCLEKYDWYIGSEFPSSFIFSKVFQYEAVGGYCYTTGVVEEENRNDIGYYYYVMPEIEEYPKMSRVLVKEGEEKDWKYIKGVPSVFKDLLNILKVYEEYEVETAIVEIHNVLDNLVVDCLSPRYGEMDQRVYGSDNELDSCLEKIIEVLKGIKVPVDEIFIFRLGDMSSCRLKLKKNGEYTLVIE